MIKLVMDNGKRVMTVGGEHTFSYWVSPSERGFSARLMIDGADVLQSEFFENKKDLVDNASGLIEYLGDLILLSETEAGQNSIFRVGILSDFTLDITRTGNKLVMKSFNILD